GDGDRVYAREGSGRLARYTRRSLRREPLRVPSRRLGGRVRRRGPGCRAGEGGGAGERRPEEVQRGELMTAGNLARVKMEIPQARKSIRRRRAWSNAVSGVLYLAPALVVFAMYLFYPAVKTGWLSTFAPDVRGMPTKVIGLDNYIDDLRSKGFRSSLSATSLFAIMVVDVTMAIAVALPILATAKVRGPR